MDRNLRRIALGLAVCSAALTFTGCRTGDEEASGTVTLMLSDASTENWATIGVRVESVALVPAGGGRPVTVYAAPNPPPFLNLAQLDELSEILGSFEAPAGTYGGAILTIGANTGDVLLTVAADPEPGFPLDPGTQVPPGQIEIRGATGDAGHRTVTVDVRLESPLAVRAGESTPLDIEFDLAHPVFIVQHDPPAGAPVWVVSFSGPLRHRPVPDLTQLVLRHLYGNVAGVAPGGAAMTVTRVLPAVPAQDPQVAVPTSQLVRILPDAVNGTIYYGLDPVVAPTVLRSFSPVAATLPGKYVRVAARYQLDGTLVAVRVWASASFPRVWMSPEGHVLHSDAARGLLVVSGENGLPLPLQVDDATRFYFRRPLNVVWQAAPIGTGPGFLDRVKRGFKVHASVVDPDAATTPVAETVDIEIARYEGAITSADEAGFTCTMRFRDPSDDDSVMPTYVASTTPNGLDASGHLVRGFRWWSFAYPTLGHAGPDAIQEFIDAVNGATASFGGTAPPISVRGASFATWDDLANRGDWSVRWTVLDPVPLPRGTVASDWAASTSGGTFGMTVPGGANAVAIGVSAVPGSATLVYRVDARIDGGVSITPQDVTDAVVLADVAGHLVAGANVRVFGIPRPDGSVRAYVLFYFTDVAS
jgi:hypothetical protein